MKHLCHQNLETFSFEKPGGGVLGNTNLESITLNVFIHSTTVKID